MVVVLVILACALAGLCAVFAATWKRESRNALIVTPIAVFCLLEVLRVWPGLICARYSGVSSDVYATLVVVSCTFAALLGYVVIRNATGWTGSPLAFWSRSLVSESLRAHYTAITFCFLLLLAAGIYQYRGLPPVVSSLRHLLSGQSEAAALEVRDGRFNLTKGHHFGATQYRGQGAMRKLAYFGWPMLMSTSLLIYFQRKRRLALAMAAVAFIGDFIFVAGDGTRAPFGYTLLSTAVVIGLSYRIAFKTYMKTLVIVIIIVFSLSAVKKYQDLTSEGTLVTEGIPRFAYRLFALNGVNTVWAIELVRSGHLNIRYGEIHVNETLASLPFVQGGEPFSYELYTMTSEDARGYTFMSMTHLAKVFVDFGWIGSIVAFVVIGCCMAIASQAMFVREKTILNAVTIGLLIVPLGELAYNGPNSLIIAIVVVFFLRYLYLACFRIVLSLNQRTSGS